MKKVIFAYIIAVFLPIAIVASGIGKPEDACYLLVAAMASAIALGAMLIFMPCNTYSNSKHKHPTSYSKESRI